MVLSPTGEWEDGATEGTGGVASPPLLLRAGGREGGWLTPPGLWLPLKSL